LRVIPRWLAGGLLALLAAASVVQPSPAFGQPEATITRKVKNKVSPLYPEMARRLSIGGTVKLVVVVAPNGSVKSSKVLGGHPLLVNAAEDALRKWKFEPGPDESSGVVEFTFRPQN